MIHEDKKENESNDSLMRRFSRKVQSTGILDTVKKSKFHQPKPNKAARKESAIRRKKRREEREYQIKIGKIEETPYYQRGRRKRTT